MRVVGVVLATIAVACGSGAPVPSSPASAIRAEATATVAATSAPVATSPGSPGRSAELVRLETRPGVTLRFLLDVPRHPMGAVVLLVGGDGIGALVELAGAVVPGPNFLARSSSRFAELGFAIALLEVPSDRSGGMSNEFRTSSEHLQDVTRVIEELSSRGIGPVHLVGTSRGSLSAASLALKGARASSIVLTSSVKDVAGLAVERLALPVLIVHNRDDACVNAPFATAAALRPRLAASPRATFIEVRGGQTLPPGTPFAGPCDPLSRHGYLGLESAVVEAITTWLSGREPPTVVGP